MCMRYAIFIIYLCEQALVKWDLVLLHHRNHQHLNREDINTSTESKTMLRKDAKSRKISKKKNKRRERESERMVNEYEPVVFIVLCVMHRATESILFVYMRASKTNYLHISHE